jgi:hypothetical protein
VTLITGSFRFDRHSIAATSSFARSCVFAKPHAVGPSQHREPSACHALRTQASLISLEPNASLAALAWALAANALCVLAAQVVVSPWQQAGMIVDVTSDETEA